MRTFYSEYVQHCMRFYTRYPSPLFKNDVDKMNWKACHSALNSFAVNERELLKEIFKLTDALPDNIYNVAIKHSVKQDLLWNLISEFENRVAKRRGLI